jgi:lipopolysaccharide export system permease protein
VDEPVRPRSAPRRPSPRRPAWPRLAIVDRHIAFGVARSYLIVLAVLLALFSFLALVEELEDLGKGRYGLGDILAVVALTTPRRALDLAAITALIGSVLAMGRLASDGELIALQSAGISTLRIGWAAVKPTLVLATVCLLAEEFVVPALDQAAHVRRARAIATVSAVRSDDGFWSRQGDRFVRVRRVSEANVLGGVEVYEFDADGRLRLFLAAERAEVGAGREWTLTGVVEKEFGSDGPRTRRLPRRAWESFIDRAHVDLLALPPSSLSFSDLYRYVAMLRASGQAAARYELALWQKISLPLAAGAMVLLAITFIFGLLRVASAGQRMMVGTSVGIAFHLGDQVASRVGLLLNVSPAITALAPVGAVLALALWLFRRTH